MNEHILHAFIAVLNIKENAFVFLE